MSLVLGLARARPLLVTLESQRDVREDEPVEPARLRRFILENGSFVWRTLVRFGVRRADAEDAAQEVFWVFARRLPGIVAGAEKGFLFRTALGVASTRRRSARRRPEDAVPQSELDARRAPERGPEELLVQRRLRQRLSQVLDALSEEQRTVFVLVELEGLSAPEAATLLDVPVGTVASRLKRARSAFVKATHELEQRCGLEGFDDGSR
jgi:RNA polymerase sigma-70 factor (ECF subfamily)